MVIYIDLLFLINCFIDGALLLLTAWTLKQQIKVWRLALSAGLGGLYVVYWVLSPPAFLYTFVAKVLYSVLMIFIAFGKQHPRIFLRILGSFYVVSLATGGGVIGISHLLMSNSELWTFLTNTRTGGLETQFFFVIGVFGVSAWLYLRVFQSTKQHQTATMFVAHVEVVVGDFHYRCRGLIDTGNQLYDPLTRTPVMVVELEPWKHVLPNRWIQHIKQMDVDRMVSHMNDDSSTWVSRVRLVPYRGINGATRFMLTIKPDQVSVTTADKQVQSSRILVGFDSGKLSSDGSYQAILHPALMEG